MGKKLKKGTKGAVSRFISRARAVKKLSIPLSDFRKICIYKGVFPRVPPNKLRSKHKTYYHVKDINLVAQDRLVDHFRTANALRKKMKTAVVAGDARMAARLRARMPRLELDRVVRERYPVFALALRDLDDPLSLVALVAAAPSHRLFKISPTRIGLSSRLLQAFKAFVAHEGLLRKVFLSAKGVYYQAMVRGQPVTWIEPYALTTVLPFDVDYKVILSFLEFYLVLLRSVVFKLYSGASLAYPPPQAARSGGLEDQDVCCGLHLRRTESEADMAVDTEFASQPQPSSGLFAGLVFFVSREVERSIFEFALVSGGGRVVWDLANFDSDVYRSAQITHVVQDRPLDPAVQLPNREHVQPQWVCDCINFSVLLPISDYVPGKPLPPHVSPFVADGEEGYVPARKRQILEVKGEFVEEKIESDEEEEAEAIAQPPTFERGEPVLVIPAGGTAPTAQTHGRFGTSSRQPAYNVKRTSLVVEEERKSQERVEKQAASELKQVQALGLSRKRRRLLNMIVAAETLKRRAARTMRQRETH